MKRTKTNICEECNEKETETHTINWCRKFQEGRMNFINRMKDQIRAEAYKKTPYEWGDVSELEIDENLWQKVYFISEINLKVFDDKIRRSRTNSKHGKYFEIQEILHDLKKFGATEEELWNWLK